MVHRFFLVRGLAGLDPTAVQHHWRERHAGVFAATPGLRGYIQDRPLAELVADLDRPLCSETWFQGEEAERDAYASNYYRETVTPDEAAFLDRGSAWRGRVVGTELVREGARAAYRVLAFGSAAIPPAGRVAVIRFDRETPGGGLPQVVSAWVDERERALEIAAAAGGVAFAAEAVSVVAPPAGSPE